MIGARAVDARPASNLLEPSRALVLWIARTLLYLAVAGAVGARSGGEAAFVRLLASGRAILAGHGVLGRFDVLASVLYAGAERVAGFAGIAALGALCALAMLVLVEAQARARGATPVWALAAAAGTAAVSIGTLSVDGNSVAWMFAAAFVWMLAGTHRSRWFVAILLAWAWAASSWIGVAAPAIALAAALGRRSDRTLLAVAAGSALAILLTPAGFELPREALAQLSIDGAAGKMLAWQPNAVSPSAYAFGLIPLVIALVWFGLPRLGDWPPALVALVLALGAGAALPLAGIVILPCLVAGSRGLAGAGAEHDRALVWTALCVALPCALFAPLAMERQAKAGVDPALPFALVERLAAEPGRIVVACVPAQWCALVDSLGRADVQAFAGDRIGSLDERRLRDQATIAHARPKWRAAVDRNGIGAILVANREPLATLLSLQPAWHELARSDGAVLFVHARRGRP